jgi:metal-responsive CopG/Arc/MetJ family transcriptional regulator
MANVNVTVTLPENLIKQARHLAVERGMSLSALVADTIRSTVAAETNRDTASQRMKEILSQRTDLGTKGHITFTREELHERG